MSRLTEIFLAALKLGLSSFGGPIAHIGYFRDEYVEKRKWLDERSYADLVALCHSLPGPASSQVGIAVGIGRGGLLGGLAAWLGFTIPSAALLIAFAYGVTEFDDLFAGDWLRGLKIVAVAVVAYALWGMAKSLASTNKTATIAVASAVVILLWNSPFALVLVILAAAILGRLFLESSEEDIASTAPRSAIGKRLGIASLVIFFGLLFALPLLRQGFESQWLDVFDSFFRSGSLVFGGGHVVLPVLQSEVVQPGWVTDEQFIAGYGAAQAVPGPLFTFSAYLGTVMDGAVSGWGGAIFALVAIFMPSFLIVVGVLPFWNSLRGNVNFRASLVGVNAAVVGFVAAALYDPVWTTAVATPRDFALAVSAFVLLSVWRWPPWLVVLLTAVAGFGLSQFE